MKPVVVLLAIAMLTGVSACSSDDSGDSAAPAVTVTTTETVTESAEPSEPEVTDYYGIDLQEAGRLLECESIKDMSNDPAYKSLGLQWHAVGLCATDNGTHSSGVFVFENEGQMAKAQADSAFAIATSTGLEAPGIIIGCVDDSVCTQFKPLLEGVSHS